MLNVADNPTRLNHDHSIEFETLHYAHSDERHARIQASSSCRAVIDPGSGQRLRQIGEQRIRRHHAKGRTRDCGLHGHHLDQQNDPTGNVL